MLFRSDDYPIYRYADCLLGLAEAKALLGEDPAAEINEVRKRAYGEEYFNAHQTEVAYPNDTDDSFYANNSFDMLSRSGKKEGIDFKHNKWIYFIVLAAVLGAVPGFEPSVISTLPPGLLHRHTTNITSTAAAPIMTQNGGLR